MKKLVVLSGAGVSADSGIKTFRDMGGLWENHRVEDVASPDGWKANPELVLDFYNQRREELGKVVPNAGHYALAELESDFDVTIITQNVDNLHERAGSSNVIHLHGELTKVRSVSKPELVYDIGYDAVSLGDLADDGSQLRPHIFWFGELVPAIEDAADICLNADIFIVVGTSMQVYPVAGLIGYVSEKSPKFIVDPHQPAVSGLHKNIEFINEASAKGLPILADRLKRDFK